MPAIRCPGDLVLPASVGGGHAVECRSGYRCRPLAGQCDWATTLRGRFMNTLLRSDRGWRDWRFRPAWPLAGLALLIPVSAALNWEVLAPRAYPSNLLMVGGSLLCMVLVSLMASRATKVPLGSVPRAVLASALLSFGVLTALLLVTQSLISEGFVAVACVWSVAWVSLGLWLRRRLIGPPQWGLAAVGCVQPLHELDRVAWVDLPDVPREIARFGAVVADMSRPHSEAWSRYLTECRLAGVPVLDASAVYEAATGRVRSEWVSETSLLSGTRAGGRLPLKLALDYICTLLVAPVAAAIVLAAAAAIKLDDGGRVFYTQNRVGLGGRTFRIFKLRTMPQGEEGNGSRIGGTPTRVGRFLRRFRVDELPQLVNGLRGEMSIVGPRPEQRAIVDAYTAEIPAYGIRHIVRPGLTGWSQVHLWIRRGRAGEQREAGVRSVLHQAPVVSPGCDDPGPVSRGGRDRSRGDVEAVHGPETGVRSCGAEGRTELMEGPYVPCGPSSDAIDVRGPGKRSGISQNRAHNGPVFAYLGGVRAGSILCRISPQQVSCSIVYRVRIAFGPPSGLMKQFL